MLNKFNNFKIGFRKLPRFIWTPGFIIAFLGTDGSGKSTIINSVSPTLRKSMHNSIFYEHMRPNFIPSIAKLFGRSDSQEEVRNPHLNSSSGTLGSFLRLLYYSFDYIVGHYIKVYPVSVKKSSVWMYDRYFYDYLIDFKRAKINLPIFIIKFIKIFIPKPDLVICLGADSKTIYARKPELPLEELRLQHIRLKAFCEQEKRAVWIDTGGELSESINAALNAIGHKMSNRYL